MPADTHNSWCLKNQIVSPGFAVVRKRFGKSTRFQHFNEHARLACAYGRERGFAGQVTSRTALGFEISSFLKMSAASLPILLV